MAKGSFGERLKRERELREVSLKEVTVATRIGTRFLEALENEEWSKLPGGVFNRGFVRSIARYLGLDEENLLAEYDMARGGNPLADMASAPENRPPAPPKWVLPAVALGALLLIAALIAAGVYGWRRYSAHRKAKQTSVVIAPERRFAGPVNCGHLDGYFSFGRAVLLGLNGTPIPASASWPAFGKIELS